jgi:membrane protein DedA with SNARE-associated domain
MTLHHLSSMVAHYGYLGAFVAVLLASGGVPVPAGELLIAAAIYAAHTHRLSITLLVLVGSAGAVLGGCVGYAIGRWVGATTLSRYGRLAGLTEARLRLGRYLFLAHGGKIVFIVRFVALIGPFGGVLAGANQMPAGRFMAFNALGGVVWTLVVGVGAYLFGAMFEAVGRPVGIATAVIAVALIAGLAIYVHRYGAELQEKADARFAGEPGPAA